MTDLRELEKTACRRLCVGSGNYPLRYWTNLDADLSKPADIHVAVPPIPFANGSLDEIFAGHLLEHMEQDTAAAFVADCYRCLAPGGALCLVVPDTREIMRRWLDGGLDHVEYPHGQWWPIADLDSVCALFLYSTVQESRHCWCYDLQTLGRLMAQGGFRELHEIDRYKDRRISVGAWYQVGIEGRKG